MARPWVADPTAGFKRRLGKVALAPRDAGGDPSCPDIWELENGDIAVIGRDLTSMFASRLPDGVSVGPDERLVVIPRTMLTPPSSPTDT